MSYYYQAFGLCIHSELFFPDFSPVSEQASEVSINYGILPKTLTNGAQLNLFTWALPGCCLMEMPGHARFLITRDTIIVERQEGADDELIVLLIQRAGFGVLLQLRGFLVLRGSGVEIDGKGVAIVASATEGSSTLAAALLKRGAKLLTDELCIIRANNDGVPEIYPAFSSLHLWRDMIVSLGENPEKLRRIRQYLEKYALPLRNEQFATQSSPLVQLFRLELQANKDISIVPVFGMLKINVLLTSCYRPSLAMPLGLKDARCNELISVAGRINIWKLGRPDRRLSFDSLAERVKETIL